MPAGVGGWVTRMSWRERKLEEKVFVIPWEWGQRGNGDHSSFPGTELKMRLQVSSYKVGDEIGRIG